MGEINDRANLEEKTLFELISSSDSQEAAGTIDRFGHWVEWIIGIGNDDVAYITMPFESYTRLIKRMNNREKE